MGDNYNKKIKTFCEKYNMEYQEVDGVAWVDVENETDLEAINEFLDIIIKDIPDG